MTAFRRYLVTDVPNGFHVTNRPHPLDAEGEPEWLRELVRGETRLSRLPVTVTREGHGFRLVSERMFDKRFSLVDYYGLVERAAEFLMLAWTPPDRVIEDEYADQGPPELREWRGVKKWATSRAAASVNKIVYDRWKRLRDEADPTALAVQRKVFSVAFGYGKPNLVMSPVFYKHPYIVKDVLAYRAAAAVAGMCGRFAYTDKDIAEALEYMADWKAVLSPSGKHYPTLNKTLMNLPPGVPAKLLLKLNQFMLPRPIMSRLELLTVILAHDSGQRNIRAFSFATEAQIAEAMSRVSVHLHADLSLLRWRDVEKAIQFMGDYPDPHNGNVVGLAELSIRWHRDHQDELAERVVEEYGNAKEVVEPPIPLPVLEGVRFLPTVGDIVQEGADMQHCIAKYAEKAVSGHSYLFHVEHQGERASVEVDWYGHVIQACGPKNEENAATGWGRAALGKWGRGLKKAVPASTAGISKFDPP